MMSLSHFTRSFFIFHITNFLDTIMCLLVFLWSVYFFYLFICFLKKLQVGGGNRSERIRTYNYPQGRITDHRSNLTKNFAPVTTKCKKTHTEGLGSAARTMLLTHKRSTTREARMLDVERGEGSDQPLANSCKKRKLQISVRRYFKKIY